ncbi:MAG: hypothetical protein HFG90_01230 [Acholeplasmatales bacterium]|jgi:tRNA A-37 threonylcarbamoyl transferase component Bud32|nr:hypothetical protein [Acholeplasmatales bacterium]
MNQIKIQDKAYTIIKLLGKGKGGYSYLVTDGAKQYVCKQIHHEPCSYYTFGDKLASELRDYEILKNIGIPVPELLSVDEQQERLLKEYIEGPTLYDLVVDDKVKEEYLTQIKQMCKLLYASNINIDYFPTNFVVQKEMLYYIDYECNSYMEEWNFENWGIKYWSKTQEFMDYFKSLEKGES